MRGSVASRWPSARRLQPRTVKKRAREGKRMSHQAGWSCFWASARIAPQLGVGGETPSPRKLIPDSSRIALLAEKAAVTRMGGKALGRKCLARRYGFRAPPGLAGAQE